MKPGNENPLESICTNNSDKNKDEKILDRNPSSNSGRGMGQGGGKGRRDGTGGGKGRGGSGRGGRFNQNKQS